MASKHRGASFVRALVLVLLMPLATSGALPSWALLFGVEAAHVCRCSVEEHDCVCPKCHPDDADDLALTTESIKGRCGDDDVAFAGKALGAVLSKGSVLTPTAERTAFVPDVPATPRELRDRPPIPPPRSRSSAV